MNAMMEPIPEGRPLGALELDYNDLTIVRAILAGMIEGMQKGTKSRERSLVITKLQEASMWANEGLRLE